MLGVLAWAALAEQAPELLPGARVDGHCEVAPLATCRAYSCTGQQHWSRGAAEGGKERKNGRGKLRNLSGCKATGFSPAC